jgi:hypothetical protein
MAVTEAVPEAATGPARRRHLFEFEDLGWFPTLFRDTITSWLADTFTGIYDPVVPLVVRLMDAAGTDRVVDLCSGGSGPWEYLKPAVDRARAEAGDPATLLTLTDRYPNVPGFAAACGLLGPATSYRKDPVDARSVPEDLAGVRTLFTSFHHLDHADARAVLADAAAAGRAIGVFDMTRRDWDVIRGVLWQVPLSMFRSIHTWRPRRPWQLFFTYVVPLIVLTSLWDAVVSQLRAYRPGELAAMTEGLGGERYRWETGEVSAPGSSDRITYVIGYPVS